jgi:hypothetical protein
LLMSLTSLSIWEAVNLASHSFPALFKCKPCLVKYFLLKSISINVTWLNSDAILLSLVLNAWTSRFVLEQIIFSFFLFWLCLMMFYVSVSKSQSTTSSSVSRSQSTTSWFPSFLSLYWMRNTSFAKHQN